VDLETPGGDETGRNLLDGGFGPNTWIVVLENKRFAPARHPMNRAIVHNPVDRGGEQSDKKSLFAPETVLPEISRRSKRTSHSRSSAINFWR
jgi:hypothetical protein